MRLLRSAALVVLWLGPSLALAEGVATPGQCKEAFDDCKEDCTMEFGTSLNTRDKFAKCMNRCTRTSDDCQERYFDVTSNKLDPDALTRKRAKDPAAAEPAKRYDPEEPLRDDGYAKPSRAPAPEPRPAARSNDEAPVRRTATRMSELGDAKPAGEKVDPMLAPAEPAKRAREPEPDPEPAPPPKAGAERRAIDDWAPGDSPAENPPPKKKEPESPPPPPREKSKAPEKKRAIDDWDPNAP